jgi:hypothetical protein
VSGTTTVGIVSPFQRRSGRPAESPQTNLPMIPVAGKELYEARKHNFGSRLAYRPPHFVRRIYLIEDNANYLACFIFRAEAVFRAERASLSSGRTSQFVIGVARPAADP